MLKSDDYVVLNTDSSSKGQIKQRVESVFEITYEVLWLTGFCAGNTTQIAGYKLTKLENWTPPSPQATQTEVLFSG